jgi:hypothetical protein
MSIEGGVGVSTHAELDVAAAEAAAEASRSCDAPSIVLMFVTHSYALDALPAAIEAVKKAFSNAPTVAGGTVNGITYGDVRYDAMFANKRALAVVAFGGDIVASAAIVGDPGEDPVGAGKTLARLTRGRAGDAPATGAIMLSPGISEFRVVDQAILDGIRAVNPRLRISGTGLCGGITPDAQNLPGHAFIDDRIERRGAVLVAFTGPVSMGFSSANGMQPVGGGGFVTAADGAMIQTIDGRPAKDALLDLLCGDDASARADFQRSAFIAAVERGITLGTADPEGGHYWCHMPVAILPDGSVVDPFIARRGTPLSVVRIDPTSCMRAVEEAGKMLIEDTGTHDFEFTIAFSCSLRGFTLGAEVAHEDLRLLEHVQSKRHLGIVANGEICCHRQGRPFSTGWVYALFGLADEARVRAAISSRELEAGSSSAHGAPTSSAGAPQRVSADASVAE